MSEKNATAGRSPRQAHFDEIAKKGDIDGSMTYYEQLCLLHQALAGLSEQGEFTSKDLFPARVFLSFLLNQIEADQKEYDDDKKPAAPPPAPAA